MIIMSSGERREYLLRLRPYLKTSLIIFGIGVVIGLTINSHFPELADQFQSSLVGFVKIFQGLPRLQLAGAIFLNNTAKTLLAIVLGSLFGVVPGFFLFVNGIVLGLVVPLSVQSRGIWMSLVSIVPHGVLELPAVFLGTSIGLMLGTHTVKSIFTGTKTTLGAELIRGLKFFCAVIVPLLLIAAFIEAFLTSALVSPK